MLYHLYTGQIREDWFGAHRIAEILCTADYFMLEELPYRLPSSHQNGYPIHIVHEILAASAAHKEIKAADKIRIIGAWFSRADDFKSQDSNVSLDFNVFDIVLSSCPVDESMMLKRMRALQKELGPLVFHRVVPGTYLEDVYKMNLAKIKSSFKVWSVAIGKFIL
ncbi:hypothetical protein HK102_002407 [Quaeritorhiza haematococci]|nr:hypothetical protein HK102_002407 [Quaeritorhiza haematococci]